MVRGSCSHLDLGFAARSKSGMTKEDYLTSDNTISDAAAMDYMKVRFALRVLANEVELTASIAVLPGRTRR